MFKKPRETKFEDIFNKTRKLGLSCETETTIINTILKLYDFQLGCKEKITETQNNYA